MRKTRVLGFALTLAATMVVGSAMGQSVLGGTNYVELKSLYGSNVSATPDKASFVEINSTNGFYVQPSDIHSSYNTAGSFVIANGFQWIWNVADKPSGATVTIPSPTTANGTASTDPTYVPANYATFSFPTAGRYTLSAAEKAPAALGGCQGDPVYFNVYAFPLPTYSLVAGVGTPNYNVAAKSNVSAPLCVTADYQATVQFQVNATGTPYVKYQIDKYPVVINPTTASISLGTVSSGTAAEEKFGSPNWTWDQAVNSEVALNATADSRGIKLTTAADTASATAKNAVYTFAIKSTLTKPTAAEKMVMYRIKVLGVNGLLTRKGQLTQASAAKPGTYSYVVDPAGNDFVDIYLAVAPKTGPVYHINNNYAN